MSDESDSVPEPLLRPEDVAAWLGVPVKTLYDWRLHCEGPKALKVGRHLRFRRQDVDAWLDKLADEA